MNCDFGIMTYLQYEVIVLCYLSNVDAYPSVG